MLPKGISLVGGSWKSLLNVLKSDPPFTEMALVPAVTESEEQLLIWWKGLLAECRSGAPLPQNILQAVSSQLQSRVDPLLREPNFYLVRLIQRVCQTESFQDDSLTPLFFHRLMESVNSDIISWLLPVNIQLLCTIDPVPWKRVSVDISEAVAHLRGLTSKYLDALSNHLYDPTGFSPRHVSLSCTRMAYQLIVRSVSQATPDNELFIVSLGFLVVLEVIEDTVWHDFMLYCVRPMQSAMTGLYELASKLLYTQNNQSDSSDHILLQRVIIELDNLTTLTRRVPTCATASYRDTFSRLVCRLFDRIASLILYAAGVRSTTHSMLWHTLFTEESARSVEAWAEFWLTDSTS